LLLLLFLLLLERHRQIREPFKDRISKDEEQKALFWVRNSLCNLWHLDDKKEEEPDYTKEKYYETFWLE